MSRCAPVAPAAPGPPRRLRTDRRRRPRARRYLDNITLDELVMAVRRQSQGFARGSSKFRGVTKHPNGRWEARIGTPGSKHVYLGLFHEESEAARAYDRALVKMRGPGSATNFSISTYKAELKEFHVQQHAELQVSLASGKGEATAHAATIFAEKANQHLA